MFKFRLVSFPVLFALFLVIVLNRDFGPWIFLAAVLFALPKLCEEILSMLGKLNLPVLPKIGGLEALAGAAMLAVWQLSPMLGLNPDREFWLWIFSGVFFGVSFVIWLLLLISRVKPSLKMLILMFGNWKSFAVKAVGTWLVIGAVFGVFGWLVMIYSSGSPANRLIQSGPTSGMWSLFYLVVVTKMMDTGGYIFGMLSARYLPGGNHKIMPGVSPRKSYEGGLGGLALSLIASILFSNAGFGGIDMNLGAAVVVGLLLGVGSLAGDLTESFLKRKCGVKDSGSLIPGMGGVFDILDSFIYNAGIFFFFL